MTLKEKFNRLTANIEELAVSGKQNIPDVLIKTYGDELRLLCPAFQYMTGTTLMQYIRCRTDNDGTPPLTFEAVTGREAEEPVKHRHPSEHGKGSIPHNDFIMVKQAMEMAALFGFSDEETELVLRLSEECGITIPRASALYDEYRLQTEPESNQGQISSFDICSLACKQNLSFSQAREILCEIDADGYTGINDLPDGFFDLWLSDYNQHVCHMEVVTICSILEEMERQNISVLQLNDMIDTAEFSSTDLYDVVANYGQANSLFNNLEEEDSQNMMEFLDPELAEFLGNTNTDDDDPFTIKR